MLNGIIYSTQAFVAVLTAAKEGFYTNKRFYLNLITLTPIIVCLFLAIFLAIYLIPPEMAVSCLFVGNNHFQSHF